LGLVFGACLGIGFWLELSSLGFVSWSGSNSGLGTTQVQAVFMLVAMAGPPDLARA